MNILFLTQEGHTAGSTFSISYLTIGLAERGHNIYVGCHRDKLLYELLENTKVKLIPLNIKSRFDRSGMRTIKELVDKYSIQIINPQSSYDRFNAVLTKWLFGLDVKVIHTRRQVSRSIGGFFQNIIQVKGTDRIVAVSDGVKKSLIRKGIPDSHISVIHNGTPVEKYNGVNSEITEKLTAEFQITEKDFVIGCVSRLKNQEQILKALQYLEYPVKMIFVGIEKQKKWEEIIDSYTQSHQVFFTGTVHPSEILAYYRLFDVKILASTMEGLSQAILESMAMGVPVIATNFSGNPEVIRHGENGLLFDDGDIDALVSDINMIKEDVGLKDRIIRNAKTTALEDFNIEKTVTGFEKLFEEMTNKKIPSKMKISSIVLTLNEEENIGRCLSSLQEVADEMIVVDSFSTDRTKEICEEFGAKFIQHKYVNHIEQKQYAATLVEHDYILMLDADECLTNELKEEIKKIKEHPDADAYIVNRFNKYVTRWIRHCGYYPDKKIRLWNRHKADIIGTNPHERVVMRKGAVVRRLHLDILHYAYDSVDEHIKQMYVYAEINARAKYKKGLKANFAIKVLLAPMVKFINKYFFQLGILDGYYGFVFCACEASMDFFKYLRLYEYNRKGLPEDRVK